MLVVTAGHPAQRRARRGVRGLTVERGDRRRRPDASVDDDRHLRGRRVRAAPRRGVRAGRPAVGAGERAGRPHHRAEPGGRVPRLADGDEAQGRRGGRGVDGRQGARSARTTSSSSSPSPRAASTRRVVIRDGKLVGATLLGDVSKVAFLMQAFDRGLPLPEERMRAAVRHRHAAVRAVGRGRTRRRRAGVQLQRRLQGRPGGVRAGRRQERRRGDGRDPGGQGLRLVQGPGRADRRVGRRRRGRGGPVRVLVRARRSAGQAGADGARSGSAAAVGLVGVRRAGSGRQGGRRQQDGAGLAAAR